MQAGNHPLDRLIEVCHFHGIFSLTSSKQGCFIDDIGEVCTDKPRSLGGDHTQVYGGGECDLFRVQPKDLLAAFEIGSVY